MLRLCCSFTQVELGKIDAVGVQRKAQKVLCAAPPPLAEHETTLFRASAQVSPAINGFGLLVAARAGDAHHG